MALLSIEQLLSVHMKKIVSALLLLSVCSFANADDFPFNNITYSSDCMGEGGTISLTLFQKGNVLHINSLEYDNFSVQEGGGGQKIVKASNTNERTKVVFFIDNNTYQLSGYENNGKVVAYLGKYTSNGAATPIYKNCSPNSPSATTPTPRTLEPIQAKKQATAPIQQPVKTKVTCEENDIKSTWVETSSVGLIRDPVGGDIDFAPSNWQHIDRTPAELEALKACIAEKQSVASKEQAIRDKRNQKAAEIQIKKNAAICRGVPRVRQSAFEDLSKQYRVNPNSISLNRVVINDYTYFMLHPLCDGIFYMPTGSVTCGLLFDDKNVVERLVDCK